MLQKLFTAVAMMLALSSCGDLGGQGKSSPGRAPRTISEPVLAPEAATKPIDCKLTNAETPTLSPEIELNPTLSAIPVCPSSQTP